VLIDHFLEDAVECDVDALCDGDDVVIAGIMQHIEEAGIHSGDSSCVLPPVDLTEDVKATIRTYTKALATALTVRGLVNIQFAIQRGTVFVIEVNPRASRTVPYVSKATGVPLAKIASRIMVGRKLKDLLPDYTPGGERYGQDLDTGSHYFVKSPVFPWGKFPGVDTVLGPEMKSTGEVMGVADNFGEAFAKAQIAAGSMLPTEGTVFLSINDHDKDGILSLAREFQDMASTSLRLRDGYSARSWRDAAGACVQGEGRAAECGRPDQGRSDSADHQHAARAGHIFDEKAIRRAAVLARIPTITTLAAARAAAEGMAALQEAR